MDDNPLSLADVANHPDYPQIDPSLDADPQNLFLPEDPNVHGHHDEHDIHGDGQGQQLKEEQGLDVEHHGIDDAAVSAIKASLAQAKAQQALEDGSHQASSSDVDIHGVDHQRTDADGQDHEEQDGLHTGTETDPTVNPVPHIAPFSRADRGQHTPHPEYLCFSSRQLFNEWIQGESSWCHFVQRRTTTPEKRAEERMKARLRAHEKMLLQLSPEEAANAPPLKRRKRHRTSAVVEKITFTCHHAGSYASKHSSALPQNKLRLNTKRSVKCNCPSRIVLTEMDTGECRIVYYWKHDGHDPFAEGELDSGRLPKVVDDWLIRQIKAGKDTDEIRRCLSISEEEKVEYIRKATEDPLSVTPDMPPALAFQMKIKYPDIYNRYRKLMGPIRSIKVPKSRRAHTGTDTPDAPSTPAGVESTAHADDDDDGGASAQLSHEQPHEHSHSHHFDHNQDLIDDMIHHQPEDPVEHAFDVDSGQHGMNLEEQEEILAQFANQPGHELAQALLRLPSGPQGEGEDDERIQEEVLKMARMAAAENLAGVEDEDVKVENAWGSIEGL